MIYLVLMADGSERPLEKAEAFFKRTLERVGAAIDKKIAPGSPDTLGPREISDLASRIEREIESELRPDQNGIKCLAPNRLKLLFTYEERSRLSDQSLDRLQQELKTAAYEFINNRRYKTAGPLQVEVAADLFVQSTTVKASFEAEPGQEGSQTRKSAAASSTRVVQFYTADGQSFRVELTPGGAPAYIGRAAGSAVHLNDPSISRLHASIGIRSNGDIVVSDLGSANGTRVNSQIVNNAEAHNLENGDVVSVGDVSLKVVIE